MPAAWRFDFSQLPVDERLFGALHARQRCRAKQRESNYFYEAAARSSGSSLHAVDWGVAASDHSILNTNTPES
jgi:hypothetical protein